MAYVNYVNGADIIVDGFTLTYTGANNHTAYCTQGYHNSGGTPYGPTCTQNYSNYNNWTRATPPLYTPTIATPSNKLNSTSAAIASIRAELAKLTDLKQKVTGVVFTDANDVHNDASFSYNKDANYTTGQKVNASQIQELVSITGSLWTAIMKNSTSNWPPDGTSPDNPHPQINAAEFNKIIQNIQSMANTSKGGEASGYINYANCNHANNTPSYADMCNHTYATPTSTYNNPNGNTYQNAIKPPS